MDRSEVHELYYIVPIANIPSVVTHGVMSHRRAGALAHSSVAMEEIQQRRDKIIVPGARPLHEYANLYFCARNPMMFKVVMGSSGSSDIAVFVVSEAVLDLPGVVIADGNASSGYTRFGPSPDALGRIDLDRVHGDWSGHLDERAKWEHSRVKCAEVLVPDLIEPRHLTRILAGSTASEEAIRAMCDRPVVEARPVFFYR